jgi:hypothetical protein
MRNFLRHIKLAAPVIILFLLIGSGTALSYEEKGQEPGDTSAAADTLRKATSIDISPERINVNYSDGTDTLILRSVEGAARGTNIARGNDIITIGRDELIDVTDSVRGEVVVLFGNLVIRGYVKGDVNVAVGDIYINPGANVEGDIFCLGNIYIDTATHVWGDIAALSLQRPVNDNDYDFKGNYEQIRFNLADLEIFGPPGLLFMAAFLLAIIFVVLSITVILPRPVGRIRFQIQTGFIKCFLVGVLITIALFPLWIIILISIIGIPIAILVYPFVVIAAFIIGAIGFTQYAGFELGSHSTLRYSGYARTTIAGTILMGSPLILATFFGFINIWPIAWILQVIFMVMQFVMFTTGLGAVFFSRFGTRPKRIRLDPKYEADGHAAKLDALEPGTDS